MFFIFGVFRKCSCQHFFCKKLLTQSRFRIDIHGRNGAASLKLTAAPFTINHNGVFLLLQSVSQKSVSSKMFLIGLLCYISVFQNGIFSNFKPTASKRETDLRSVFYSSFYQFRSSIPIFYS